MIMDIGIIAGEVLILLDEIKEPLSVQDVKSRIQYPDDLVMMGIGWLAREKYIHIKKIDDTYYLCCCENDSVHCPR